MKLLLVSDGSCLETLFSEMAAKNGWDVTTFNGLSDVRTQLLDGPSKLFGFEVVVYLCSDGIVSLANTDAILRSLGSETQRVFMVSWPQDGSVAAATSRANAMYGQALADSLGIPFTGIVSANILELKFESIKRGNAVVPRGTCHVVSADFFCRYMLDVIPAITFTPPNNELVISTSKGYSRGLLSSLVAASAGVDIRIDGEVNESPLDPVPAAEAFGLPIYSEDDLLADIRRFACTM